MMLTFILILNVFLFLFAGLNLLKSKRENSYLRSLITSNLTTNEEMRKTMAMGLYYRFCKTKDNAHVKGLSKIFIKQDHHKYEQFVAEVMEQYYGGYTFTSPPSSEFGIHIEHDREDGLYLGMVLCHELDLSFETIAVMHSQMVKQNAEGAFIVTTSDFSDLARKYAKNLKVELINGEQLVEYWLRGYEQTNKEIKALKSIPDIT